ncbi:hypothetical protein EYF80_053685 [Liparis tanakae]|uniref:Uncharacterized protein n=1 Tax=Liparis tanakae TaxID=230148 RepID=A0A4Z2F5G3_9TELE|nr:hypothetical protein EYF80_053685 [Liparis tanakae]
MEQRWRARDGDVAVKLWERGVSPAGGRWRENHGREYHAVANQTANSQLRWIRRPAAPRPRHALTPPPPPFAAEAFPLRRGEQQCFMPSEQERIITTEPSKQHEAESKSDTI